MKLKAWMVNWLPVFLLALSFPVAFAVAFVTMITLSDWHDMHKVEIAGNCTLAVMFVATVVASVIAVRNRLKTHKGTIIPSVIAFLGVVAICTFFYLHHRAEANEELQLRQWQLYGYSAQTRSHGAIRLAALGKRAKAALPALVGALEHETDIAVRQEMEGAIYKIGGEGAHEVTPMEPPTIVEVRVELAQQAEGSPNVFIFGEKRYEDADSLVAAISRQTGQDVNIIMRLLLESGVQKTETWVKVHVAREGSNVVYVDPIETAERLLELIEKSGDEHAMYELGWRREERAVPLLCEILESRHAKKQQLVAAVIALGEIGAKAEVALPLLDKLSKDEDPDRTLRREAMRAAENIRASIIRQNNIPPDATPANEAVEE